MTYRSFGWLALAWGLGGCVANQAAMWASSGEDPSLKRAIYECQEESDNRLRWAAGFGGIFVPIAAAVKAPGKFDECMVSRGYQRAP